MKMKLLFFVLMLSGCKKEKWIGIVYPNKNDLTTHEIVGEFSSSKLCLMVVAPKAGKKGSYECAKNCNLSTMPMVCEETIDEE